MTQLDMLVVNGTVRCARHESKWAHQRRIRRQMRLIWPSMSVPERLFWWLAGLLAASSPVAFVVMFIKWWVCA